MYVLRMKTTDKIRSDITCGLVYEITYKRFISVIHYGQCVIVAMSDNHDSDKNLNQVSYCFSQQPIAEFDSLTIYCNSSVKTKSYLISECGLVKHNVPDS
jgi:hypothetical protein